MRTYILYHFKFWRYLLVSVGFILSIIFGLIYIALAYNIEIEGWDGVFFFILTGITMFLGIMFGAKISTYIYEIQITEKGLQMVIKSPIPFIGSQVHNIAWDDLGGYNLEGYGNGDILTFSLISTGEKYSFTNSIFKKSTDMKLFYQALEAGADAFNEQHATHKPIGVLPGFYASNFALWSAILLAILMIVIPILLISIPSEKNNFPYFRLLWFYLLCIIIIVNVYSARKNRVK